MENNDPKEGYFRKIERKLARYRFLIGLGVFIMLIVLSILTYMNFDKQNQIIETGGFTDGKIKCVCSEEAYNLFTEKSNINFSNFSLSNNLEDGSGSNS